MDVKERINQFIKSQGISNADLERELELSSGAFRKVKNISSSFLLKFTGKYSSISAEWLLRGKGSMLIDNNRTNQDCNNDEIQKLQERIARLEGENEILKGVIGLNQKEKEDVV